MTTTEVSPGQRVCVYGWGTANGVHRHVTIERITKTMIVTSDGRRFSRRVPFSSIPQGGYGGTTISMTCQGQQKGA